MGNIEWFSFKRNVSDEEMTKVLQEVATELWGTAVEVEQDLEWGHWTGSIREDLAEEYQLYHTHIFNLYREGPRKFGGKMGRGVGRWIQVTLLEGAASRIGYSIFSNECDPTDTWRPEPMKYPTYADYMQLMNPASLMEEGERRASYAAYWDQYVKDILASLPPELTLVEG